MSHFLNCTTVSVPFLHLVAGSQKIGTYSCIPSLRAAKFCCIPENSKAKGSESPERRDSAPKPPLVLHMRLWPHSDLLALAR